MTLWACLLVASASLANTKSHTVKAGDNDHTIAKSVGLSVQELHRLNPNTDWTRLQIGDKIVVGKAAKKAPSKPTPVRLPSASGTHTVKSGESDYSIARLYKISTEQLHGLNPSVSFSPLQIGAKLKVPAPAKPVVQNTPSKTEQAAAPRVVTASVTPNSKEISTENAVVIASNVVMRKGPSTSHSKITTLSKWTILRVVEKSGEWYRLESNTGTDGWVLGKFLQGTTKPMKPAPVAKSAKPKSAPTLPAVASTASSQIASRILATADTLVGIRYVYGGTSRSGFDCSGFVGYVFRQHGISLPRTSLEQSKVGTPVSRGSLMPGDLVFFRTRGSRISHVGISLGGDRFIHASSGGGRIRKDTLTGYYANRYAGARRVLKQSFTVSDNTDFTPSTSISLDDPDPIPTTPKTNLGSDVVVR